MPSSSDSIVPRGDSQDRSSTGIRGPYPIPVDDDDAEIDVADATIVDLEDGFSIFGEAPAPTDDLTERYEVFGRDVLDRSVARGNRESSLERDWLVEHGER